MENNRPEEVRTASLLILATIGSIGALYVGGQFLVPIALAIVLNILFRPVVRHMQRIHIPATISAAVVVLGLMGLMVAGGYALTGPVKNWISRAPQTFAAADQKLDRYRQPLQKIFAVADQAKRAVNGAGHATSDPASAASSEPATADEQSGENKAVAVEQPQPAPIAPPTFLLRNVVGTTTEIVGSLVEVLLLLFLLLSSGSMFLDKLLCVFRRREDKKVAESAVHEAEHAVRRYLRLIATINACQGVVVGLVMWWIGLPTPILWGLATLVLEFVPYLGAITMVILLSATSLAMFDSIGHILAAPFAYMVITTLQTSVISPMTYGKELKLNPVAVLIGVLFWWYVWGVPGAFLAVPIIAIVKIIADEIDGFRPVGEFLGE